jgi:hypothetical protein
MSTVGAGCWGVAPATGNQWARILVPSNEVMVQSEATPGTGVATTGAAGGRWQGGGFHDPPESVTEPDEEAAEALPHPTPTLSNTPASRAERTPGHRVDDRR